MKIIRNPGYHGQKTQNSGHRCEEDRPKARGSGRQNGFIDRHALFPQFIGIIDQNNSVIDHDPGKGDHPNA